MSRKSFAYLSVSDATAKVAGKLAQVEGEVSETILKNWTEGLAL